MKLIDPKVELFSELDCTNIKHVARCARVCYGREGITNNAEKMVDSLIMNHHTSMLRHATKYLYLKDLSWIEDETVFAYFNNNPYYRCFVVPNTKDPSLFDLYMASNLQSWIEDKVYSDYTSADILTPTLFLNICKEQPYLFEIFRLTFCLTTQISTSRELNRVSPNNIAERSTRYCSSKDGLQICKPWWWNEKEKWRENFINSWQVAEDQYKNLIQIGVKPEDARGVLPLETMTKVIYTYSIKEWKHIINLRYYGKTGKPHPDAKLIIGMVRDQINDFIKKYNINYEAL